MSNDASHDPRVCIIDEAALIADATFAVLTGRNAIVKQGMGGELAGRSRQQHDLLLCTEEDVNLHYCHRQANRGPRTPYARAGPFKRLGMTIRTDAARRPDKKAARPVRRGALFRLSESPSHLLRRAEQFAAETF